MANPLFDEFVTKLRAQDKRASVDFVLSKLKAGEVDIVTLYSEILAPGLNTIECKEEDEGKCIWQEHVQTAIVRTIVELCYPFILAERDKTGAGSGKLPKVVVLNPPIEQHEMGSRMVADFFLLAGFDVTFIGANTPDHAIISALKSISPEFIVISVLNYYHLVSIGKIIKKIRTIEECKDLTIIVGGRAFQGREDLVKNIGADMLLNSFSDIQKLKQGGK